MSSTPLSTIALADWDATQAHITQNTSAASYVLPELTALLGADLHHLVLDPESRTIWWAYDNTPLDGDGWTIEQLTPEAVTEQLADQIDMIQDRMDEAADPDSAYANGFYDLNRDQAAFDEYAEIMRLALPADPAEMATRIRRKREVLARQDALWQRAYANMVRDLAGTERGGKTRAARPLGVTEMQVGRIIREEEQRRAKLADAVRQARRDLSG